MAKGILQKMDFEIFLYFSKLFVVRLPRSKCFLRYRAC